MPIADYFRSDLYACVYSPLSIAFTPLAFSVTSYMYKFGRSEPQDPCLESRISRKVAEFFNAKWRKRETAQGPHDRSKTVSYVQKYSQPSTNGPPIQHNTCAQQTCTVRMVGRLSFEYPTDRRVSCLRLCSLPVNALALTRALLPVI